MVIKLFEFGVFDMYGDGLLGMFWLIIGFLFVLIGVFVVINFFLLLIILFFERKSWL